MQIKEQRFKALFLSESGRMYKAAYILLGDEDEAKDVVQDIFAKLWTGTIPLKEESQRTYLLTCVRNRCLNIIAHRQTQQEAIRLLTPEAIAEENHDDEIVEMVNRYVDEKLSPQTSRIIKMHFDEDQSYKDISNKKEEQIRMLLHPEKYTDEQLDQMLDEVNIPVPEASREWMRFEKKRSGFPVLKIAASIIGVLMLSGIAYATIAHFIETDEKPKTAITESKPDVDKVEKTYGMEVPPTKKAPVEFNNVELQQIMKYVSDNYNVKVEFKNNDARTIRFYLQWEADNTLQEIIDKINHFEKVRLTLNEETITIE